MQFKGEILEVKEVNWTQKKSGSVVHATALVVLDRDPVPTNRLLNTVEYQIEGDQREKFKGKVGDTIEIGVTGFRAPFGGQSRYRLEGHLVSVNGK